MELPVTLQINTAPVDWVYLPKILNHQLSAFGEICKEIVITIETRQSKKTRWESEKWNHDLDQIFQLCEELKVKYPQLRVNPIEYSEAKRKEVTTYFIKNSKRLIPFKDFRGGPYYSYYYGLFSASQPYILHMDSDMLFCGNGASWLNEALTLRQQDKKALFISPIIGPPVLPGKKMPKQHPRRYNPTSDYEYLGNGYTYKDISTRVFLVEKSRLRNFGIYTRPNFDQQVKSWMKGINPYHTPERSLSKAMQSKKLYRVDFHGSSPGLYSIHNQIARRPDMIEMLDHVIKKVSEGFFLEEDRGLQDFNPPYLDALRESFQKE